MKKSIRDVFLRKAERDEKEDLYKVKKVPYQKDDMRLLEKLMKVSLKGVEKKTSLKTLYSSGGFGGNGFNNEKDQRVMFKMSYSPSKTVHEKYLRTYMPQENKSQVLEKPELFGTPDEEYYANIDGLHFKCIISPESQDVDLSLLSREFIKRMEVLTGHQFYWKGCIHKDTEHKHAHLCINGKDTKGRTIRFPKEMIKTTMRETLSYVATLMVGKRTEQEIEAAKSGMTGRAAWTKLDEELEARGKKISLNGLPTELSSRLAFLAGIGLSEKKEHFWELKDDWKDVLVSNGRYNTFLEEWQKCGGNLELYEGGVVSGICERVITFDKDESWNDAVIVNDGQKSVYVPIWQLTKENLVGKKISISGGTRALSRQVRSNDIRIINEIQDLKKNRKH